MQLDFLAAEVPLVKAFFRDNGEIAKHPYPNVRDITSIRRDPQSLQEAFIMLQAHAEEGHALLKGLLDRPLINEPRAGHTNSTQPTNWIYLDIDTDHGFVDPDDILTQLGLSDTTYILHHSCSAGITQTPGIRCHLMLQLAAPVAPAVLKLWLQEKNLSVPGFAEQVTLSSNKQTLSWPLDITTCQNDKILYIADPIMLDGIADPLAGDRFEFHQRTHDTATFNTKIDPSAVFAAAETKIADLRAETGLPRRKARYNTPGVLLNPERGLVTGERRARGFVYINLNGGDSWAYYYPENNPTILYNFKGEPPVRLQDIDPDYFSQVNPQRELDVVEPNTERFICRDNIADAYYTCIVKDGVPYLNRAQRAHLADFLLQTGDVMPDHVPEWTIEFDPTTTEVYNPKKAWINTFRPSPLLQNVDAEPAIGPQTRRILESLCGTAEVQDHFINWLAYYFQTRKKPKTSFIFSGVEGTGKGLLFQYILQPLFGPDNCILTTVDAIRDSFNAWAETKLILCLDEFKVEKRDAERVPELLRNLITEEFVAVRGMRKDRRQTRNHLAVLIFTNRPDPMPLSESDRRYTVAPRQTKRLPMTTPEINELAEEVTAFAAYLHQYPADEDRAKSVLATAQKHHLRQAGESVTNLVMQAFTTGDIDFLLESLAEVTSEFDNGQVMTANLIKSWANEPDAITVTYDHIREVINHLVKPTRPLTTIAARKLAETHLMWPRTQRGFVIRWQTAAYPPPRPEITTHAAHRNLQ